MKRYLLPLVVVTAMMFAAACGGSDDAKTPVADPPAAEALSQAEFAPKVKAAVGQKSTFHVVTTTTDEDGPVTFASDVKVAPTVTDLSGTGAGGIAVMRIAGKFYGKGEGLTEDPGKPWKMWDPTAMSTDPMSVLTGVQLKIQATQALTHELLAGAEYATKFSSGTGEAVDGVPTTKYTITIDAPKAAAAKALGEYLTTEVVTAQKIKDVTATVLVDKDSLPHKLDFAFGTSKVSAQFSKFGAPVTITAPAAAQIDV